jgi:lipoprotein-anchoring transpeptidase ErfK/SrfK
MKRTSKTTPTRRTLPLGRIATVLLLLGAGGAGYWFRHDLERWIRPATPAGETPRGETKTPPPRPPLVTNAEPPWPTPPSEPKSNPPPQPKPEPSTNLVPPVPPPPTPPPRPAPEPPAEVTAALATNATYNAQLALDHLGISVGPIDGKGGEQTAAALRAFQMQHGLETSGRLDHDTAEALKTNLAPTQSYVVTEDDLGRIMPTPAGWLEKAAAPRLDYNSLIEEIAERFHASRKFLTTLNPGLDWGRVRAGDMVTVPNARFPDVRAAALVRVSLSQHWVRAFDGNGNLLAHFPCSIGRIAEKRPVGELAVAVVVKNPDYTFNPAVFPESPEAQAIGRKLRIPPGPRNPVGVAWIGLNRPGYGMHGTPQPEQVGRTESHGCFRLANWNADQLRRMVKPGTPVWIEK